MVGVFSQIGPRQFCHSNLGIWVFPKIVVPQNGWFRRENPIRIDDLWVPLFLETPISLLGGCLVV